LRQENQELRRQLDEARSQQSASQRSDKGE
jgi:hypothetical protein